MRTSKSRAKQWSAIAAATAVLVLGVAGPASAAPTISVNPGGPYQNGATVTVTAEGFSAGSNVVVAQCKGAGPITDPRLCADPATGASVTANVASGGKVTATLKVVLGDIRPGVSCASSDCVITVINVGQPTTENAFVKLGTTSGTGAAPPTSGSSPTTASTPTATATNPVVPVSPTPTPTPTPAATSATPTPVATAIVGNGAPAGTPAKVTTALPHTGPDDAIRSLLAGIVVLQLGLIAVVRIKHKRRRTV